MSSKVVECIPNFSEARRTEVVDAIVAAINAVPDVHILDRHSDLDHNRTVITFVGKPAAAEEAAFQAIATAAKLIDLDQHTGAHPRIGATDVVPFVPISEITMQECVEMARRLGKRVGQELSIPVYLYEEAATRPERTNLENIRRGQYEALKVELGVDPNRDPDFGPARVGPAGATVIGARQPLIAFNVYLSTSDVSIAQKIAKAIRNSSGGLRYIKSMGVLVEGRAQVSMNLTNYRQTPLARVVEMIRREAERYGVGIHHSELVGLIPQEALIDAAVWYTQMDQFEPDQILEQRLFEEVQAAQARPTVSAHEPTFLDQLAAATATPGGGAAAAYTGAQAAALLTMVARVTVGKKKYAAVEAEMWKLIEASEALRVDLTSMVAEDSAAFESFMDATRLPKDTEEQQAARAAAMQQATLIASQVPLKAAGKSLEVLRLAVQAVTLGNLNAISDAGSAAALARAAITCAGLNVRINALGLQDQITSASLLDSIRSIEAQADDVQAEIHTQLSQRGGMNLD